MCVGKLRVSFFQSLLLTSLLLFVLELLRKFGFVASLIKLISFQLQVISSNMRSEGVFYLQLFSKSEAKLILISKTKYYLHVFKTSSQKNTVDPLNFKKRFVNFPIVILYC